MPTEAECHEEHREIKGKLVSIEDAQNQHINITHKELLTAKQIAERDARIEAELEELACKVLGEKRSEFMGGGRDESGTMKEKVESLYEDSQNGGIKTRLGKGVVALFVAMIAAMGTMGASLISHGGDTQTVVDERVDELSRQLDVRFEQLRQEILEVGE